MAFIQKQSFILSVKVLRTVCVILCVRSQCLVLQCKASASPRKERPEISGQRCWWRCKFQEQHNAVFWRKPELIHMLNTSSLALDTERSLSIPVNKYGPHLLDLALPLCHLYRDHHSVSAVGILNARGLSFTLLSCPFACPAYWKYIADSISSIFEMSASECRTSHGRKNSTSTILLRIRGCFSCTAHIIIHWSWTFQRNLLEKHLRAELWQPSWWMAKANQ